MLRSSIGSTAWNVYMPRLGAGAPGVAEFLKYLFIVMEFPLTLESLRD